MATANVVAVEAAEESNVLETTETPYGKVQRVKVKKIGKREKGTEAIEYETKQIETLTVTDPASLLSVALEFLDNNFEHLKEAVKNGVNQKRRFIDAPGSDPFEQIMKFMAKKGISSEALLEKLTK